VVELMKALAAISKGSDEFITMMRVRAALQNGSYHENSNLSIEA
jgi:hypothetical protein